MFTTYNPNTKSIDCRYVGQVHREAKEHGNVQLDEILVKIASWPVKGRNFYRYFAVWKGFSDLRNVIVKIMKAFNKTAQKTLSPLGK